MPARATDDNVQRIIGFDLGVDVRARHHDGKSCCNTIKKFQIVRSCTAHFMDVRSRVPMLEQFHKWHEIPPVFVENGAEFMNKDSKD